MRAFPVILFLAVLLVQVLFPQPDYSNLNNSWIHFNPEGQWPWSGGDDDCAIDTRRGHMYMVGGCNYHDGAGGSHNSDIFRLNIKTGTGVQLCSTGVGISRFHGRCQGGQTYDPNRDCIWFSGGENNGNEPGPGSMSTIWRWQCPNGPLLRYDSYTGGGVDYLCFDTHRDFIYFCGPSYLYKWDPKTETTTKLANPPSTFTKHQLPCCFDTKRGVLVYHGGKYLYNGDSNQWTTTGTSNSSEEMAYDSKNDAYVSMGGGGISIYYPSTGNRTSGASAGASITKPAWDYDPVNNVFVGFGNSSGHVYVYRLAGGNSGHVQSDPFVTIIWPDLSETYDAKYGLNVLLKGTAIDPELTSISWNNNLGGSGSATGLETWSAIVPLHNGNNVIIVTATDNQSNSGSDTITISHVTPPVSPELKVTFPTDTGSYITSSPNIDLNGTAYDNIKVVSGTWSSDQGHTGSINLIDDTCYTTWSAAGLQLETGDNVITITGQDGDNNSGSVQFTVTRLGPGMDAQVLFKDGIEGYTGTRDAYMYSYHNHLNYGKKEKLELSANEVFKSLVKFTAVFGDKALQIAYGSTIKSAKLRLHLTDPVADNVTLNAIPLKKRWEEGVQVGYQADKGESNWDAARLDEESWEKGGAEGSSDVDSTLRVVVSVNPSMEWIEFEVKDYLQKVSDRAMENYGWLITMDQIYRWTHLHSREWSNPAFWPELKVTYTVGGVSTAQLPANDPTSGGFFRVSPNPFNQETRIAISYRPSAISQAELNILNVNGRLVKKLTVDSNRLAAGINWTASGQAAGVYIVRVNIGGRRFDRKIFLLK
jgi:hypothetical protein